MMVQRLDACQIRRPAEHKFANNKQETRLELFFSYAGPVTILSMINAPSQPTPVWPNDFFGISRNTQRRLLCIKMYLLYGSMVILSKTRQYLQSDLHLQNRLKPAIYMGCRAFQYFLENRRPYLQVISC